MLASLITGLCIIVCTVLAVDADVAGLEQTIEQWAQRHWIHLNMSLAPLMYSKILTWESLASQVSHLDNDVKTRFIPDQALSNTFLATGTGTRDRDASSPLFLTHVSSYRAEHNIKQGGLGLKLRLTLTDGSQYLFKPFEAESPPDDSTHMGKTSFSFFAEELVAFHLSQLMHLPHVPPAAVMHVWSDMYDDALQMPALRRRFEGNVLPYAVGGRVLGSLQALLPGLHPVSPPPPCLDPLSRECAALHTQYHRMAAQALVFDFVLGNDDRFTGGNIMSPRVDDVDASFDSSSTRTLEWVWLDHDASSAARPLHQLPLYRDNAVDPESHSTGSRPQYWAVQNIIMEAKVSHMIDVNTCVLEPAALRPFDHLCGPHLADDTACVPLSAALQQTLRDNGVYLHSENFYRSEQRFQLVMGRIITCRPLAQHAQAHTEL